MGEKYPIYRESHEDFTNREKARKRYNRLVELHTPEWEISIGNVTSGIFNMIIASNDNAHMIWLLDEHGYRREGFNLDKVRESVEAGKIGLCEINEEGVIA